MGSWCVVQFPLFRNVAKLLQQASSHHRLFNDPANIVFLCLTLPRVLDLLDTEVL